MIPTFFTALALGTITNTVAAIMALSGWLSGSAIIQGNQFFDSTANTTPTVYSDTVAVIGLPVAGTNTGVSLKVGGLDRSRWFASTCTSTGGNVAELGTYYDTCLARSPYTSTGILLDLSLECGNTPIAITGSGGFVKGPKQNVIAATAIPIFAQTKVAGSGSKIEYGTGRILWNPADRIKIQTRTTIPKTTGIDCKLYFNVADKYGS